MSNNTYSVEQLVNSTLWAKSKTPIYNSALKVIRYVKSGQYIGVVDSWIVRNNIVYLVLFSKDKKTYLVKPADRTIDEDKIRAQGVKNVEQQAKDKKNANENNVERFVRKYGLPIAAMFAAALLLKKQN